MVPSATKAPTCSSMEGRLGSVTISINYGGAGREPRSQPSVGCRCRIIPLTFHSQSPLWRWEQEAVRREPHAFQRSRWALAIHVISRARRLVSGSYTESRLPLLGSRLPCWVLPRLHILSFLSICALDAGKVNSWQHLWRKTGLY